MTQCHRTVTREESTRKENRREVRGKGEDFVTGGRGERKGMYSQFFFFWATRRPSPCIPTYELALYSPRVGRLAVGHVIRSPLKGPLPPITGSAWTCGLGLLNDLICEARDLRRVLRLRYQFTQSGASLLD